MGSGLTTDGGIERSKGGKLGIWTVYGYRITILQTTMTSLRIIRKLSPSPGPRHAAAPPSTPLYLQETTISPAPTPEPADAEPELSSNTVDHHQPASSTKKSSRLSFLPTPRNREEHDDADDQQLPVPEYTPQSLQDALLMALNPFHIRLILANTGSVARDHLSLERTFLSYVRTSLAMASAGVALVQLFTSSQSKAPSDGSSSGATHVIRPLGSVMVIYGLIVLVMGTVRYFRIQNMLPHGIFPTSLHGVAGISFILGSLITIVFSLLIAGAT